MTVSTEKLVRMAEDIAANVTAGDDVQLTAERTADHLRRFWDPRMRRALIEAADDLPLSPAVAGAVAQLTR